jgi:putative oxidoreductase
VKKTCGECESFHKIGPFLGRLFISLIFILAGAGKISDFSGGVKFIEQMGIPAAQLLIVIALILELGCGLLILLGCYTRLASWLLVIFLIPITVIFHAFWNYEGDQMASQMSNFFKNIAIMGGLILLASYGPGRWSVDAKFAKQCRFQGSPSQSQGDENRVA